jgi:hypothetical protein
MKFDSNIFIAFAGVSNYLSESCATQDSSSSQNNPSRNSDKETQYRSLRNSYFQSATTLQHNRSFAFQFDSHSDYGAYQLGAEHMSFLSFVCKTLLLIHLWDVAPRNLCRYLPSINFAPRIATYFRVSLIYRRRHFHWAGLLILRT